MNQVFSEVVIGEGVAFSRIQFPTDVTPTSNKMLWANKYKVITDTETVIKTKDEILAMPNFKSNIIIDPVLEHKRMTYSVDFKINNGSFTSFASKIHQEFIEDVADQGISFNKVEFPELSGVNIGINRWDGITFKYKGEDKTKIELSALVFKENIELTIDPIVQSSGYQAVFIKTNGVHYDRRDDVNYTLTADAPNYKITSIPRVDIGLTEKVYNEFYNFNNKWKMHTVKMEAGTETPDQYIQDIRSADLLDHVFDKDLALVPILGKKDVNAVFIQDESKYSYPSGFSKLQPIQVENIGDLSIPASKIVFTYYLILKPGYKWEDKKCTFKQGDDPEVIGTPDELKTQIITKGPVLITPIVTKSTKSTYKVTFMIKDGGEFTLFQGKEEQEFTEEVAGEGISFDRVEFPGEGDINATPYVWDGITFNYNGKITTAERLKAEDKKFNSNITIVLMTEPGEYKVTFFGINNAVYYDRRLDEPEYYVNYPEFKFTQNLPRVDLGLEESTKFMDRLYKHTGKWDVYKKDPMENWDTKEFFKTMTSDEFKNYKIDKEIGIYPNLSKKDIDVIFEDGGLEYVYPGEFNKQQKLQVENIGDTSISMSKIQFPEIVGVIDGGAVWEGKKWIVSINGITDSITATKEELASRTFNDTVNMKPLVALLPPPPTDPGAKPADFDTKVELTENDKEYWIRSTDKSKWDHGDTVEGWNDETKTKENIKKIPVLLAYTHLVAVTNGVTYLIREKDFPAFTREETVKGSTKDGKQIHNIKRGFPNTVFTYDIHHWDGKVYKIYVYNRMQYEQRIAIEAMDDNGSVFSIRRKLPEEEGYTTDVEKFSTEEVYVIKPESKPKWDNYEEVAAVIKTGTARPDVKIKNDKMEEVYTSEVWFAGVKYHIEPSQKDKFMEGNDPISCWDGSTVYNNKREVPKKIREKCNEIYTKKVKADDKEWYINPSDETKWNNREEVPVWDGSNDWCKTKLTRPNYDTIYTELVTNRDGKKYYIEPGHDEDWKKSVELDGTSEEDRNTKIKVKRTHLKEIYSSLVEDEEHYYKYYVKPEDVSKWNNFEKVYAVREYNMNNMFWEDSIIQEFKKLHMNEKFKFDIQHNGKTYYLRTSENVIEYYDFFQVKAWKGEIDDFLDENAYEKITRPAVEAPVKEDTPTTPGKVKVTFWGGPNCDLIDMADPNTIELDEETAEGASLANLIFPNIKFKSFVRNDIGYNLSEGNWKISYMKDGRWRTLNRATNSIKKITAKGNVLIQPNPGKQR